LRFGFFAEMAALAGVQRDFDFRRGSHPGFEGAPAMLHQPNPLQ
jgi:hypothetical protein